MPRPAKKSYAKKRVAKKRTYRKKPTTNSTSSMIKDNHARISSMNNLVNTLMTNTPYNFQFTLANASQRVQTVAAAYQEFRIEYVEVRLKPYYDTFSTSLALAGTTAPQLYHQIIKDPSCTDIVDISQYRFNGINPMPFAKDGNKIWRYKPAASIVPQGTGASASGMIKVSPWLDTEDFTSTAAVPVLSTTVHYGSALWINAIEATPVAAAQVEVEVHYAFRKPRSDALVTDRSSTTIVL